MKYPLLTYLMIIGCVAALAVGQLLFKLLSSHISGLVDIFADQKAFLLFLAAATLYASSTLAWILILRTVPLSHAYLFMSLGFILVPAMSYAVLGENLTIHYAIGAVMIALGVWLAAA